jgi:hypothetical protein
MYVYIPVVHVRGGSTSARRLAANLASEIVVGNHINAVIVPWRYSAFHLLCKRLPKANLPKLNGVM